MIEMFSQLFDTNAFMPHGHCYLWRPDILWLNVGSDAIIAFSYFTIPLFLFYLVRKRKDLAFNWIIVMFALFILACGSSHVLEIWTVWTPNYGAQGLVKLFTAIVSLATTFALVPLMPKALKMPSTKDMEEKSRELARANEQLRELNASLESRVEEKTRDLAHVAAIVEYSNDAIIGKDMDGIILAWNPAAERLFGYKASEIIGRSSDCLVPRDLQNEWRLTLESVHQGEICEPRDTRRLTKEGHSLEVSVAISPIKDSPSRIVGSSTIARDISKRRAMEVKLRKSSDALQKKNTEMEQFVYTVSHDLKSPVVTSSGFLGLLREDLAAARYDLVLDSVARLDRANGRMSQLIDDLLQLSRIGRIKLAPEMVKNEDVIQRVCENLSTQLMDRNITLSVEPNMPDVPADSKRVYQVFENLIINACKYACDGPNPTIEIGYEDRVKDLCFYVRDHGPGIEAQYHTKIFGLFQRLENDSRGTGVGLTIVASIMQQHGGRAWVESEPGHGACFWLAFPRVFTPLEDNDDAE